MKTCDTVVKVLPPLSSEMPRCENKLVQSADLRHELSVMQQNLTCLQGHALVLSEQSNYPYLLIQFPEALAATKEVPTDAGILPLNIVQRLCWPPVTLQQHASSSTHPMRLPTESSHAVHMHTGVHI